METQTWLSRHNKFILAENIVGIFSVSSDDSFTCSVLSQSSRGACGVMVIVVGNGHGDTNSNPGRDWEHFT